MLDYRLYIVIAELPSLEAFKDYFNRKMSEINKKELEQVLTKEVLKANEELFVLFHPKDHPRKSSLPPDWMDRDEMDTALDELAGKVVSNMGVGDLTPSDSKAVVVKAERSSVVVPARTQPSQADVAKCMQEMQTKSNSGAPSLKRLKRAEEKLPEKKVDQDEAEEVAASVLEDLKQGKARRSMRQPKAAEGQENKKRGQTPVVKAQQQSKKLKKNGVVHTSA